MAKDTKRGFIATIVKFVCDAGMLTSNLLMAAMLLIVMMNVALRYVVGSPVYWGDTLMTWLLMVMVYMGLASAVSTGSNIRMTALTDRLQIKKQNILAAICSVFNITYFGILVWAAFVKTKNSFITKGYDKGTDWYYWPVQAIIIVGVAIALIACIVLAVERFGILWGKSDENT